MTGFEPRTSGIGSGRSTNWGTTTAPLSFIRQSSFSFIYFFRSFFVGFSPGAATSRQLQLQILGCQQHLLSHSLSLSQTLFLCHTHSYTVTRLHLTSVTRLGYFWKVLETFSLTKLAQILGNFLCYLKKLSFYVITDLAPFWATLVKIGLLLF